jgi:hypothetical protein
MSIFKAKLRNKEGKIKDKAKRRTKLKRNRLEK